MDYVAMGARIRAYRKQCGLTQAMLAKSVGISTSFIGHIERGTRITSLETMVGLAQVLEVSLDQMVKGDGTNVNSKKRMLNDVMRILDEHSNEWMRDE